MTPSDFRWHVANQQPPGTSDTSRFATDHIDNPNAINTIFNLSFRPAFPEQMRDGSKRPGEPHPQGRRGLGRDRRRVASRLRQHRHVRRLLDHAARSHLRREEGAGAVRHGPRADRVRGLAQHRSADAGRRGVSENARAAAPGRRAWRPGVSDGERRRRGAPPRQDRLRRQVRHLPFEQAAAGGDRGHGRRGRVVSRSRCSLPTS